MRVEALKATWDGLALRSSLLWLSGLSLSRSRVLTFSEAACYESIAYENKERAVNARWKTVEAVIRLRS